MNSNFFKTLLCLFFVAGICLWNNANGQDIRWNWATEFNSNIIRLEDFAIDDEKNAYATGFFWEDRFFVDGEPVSNDSGFCFFVKVDSLGDLQWAKIISAGHLNGGWTVDYGNGHVYLGVRTEQMVILDGDTLQGNNIFNPLIVKYDPDGQLVDHVLLTSAQSFLHTVAISDQGDLFVGGGMVLPMKVGNDSLKFDGLSGAFLVKLDPDLNPQWSRKIDSDNFRCQVTKCVADPDGNVICILEYFTNAIFGSDTLRPRFNDIGDAVVKYSPTGELKWIYSVEGFLGERYLLDIDSDPKGNIYVAGTSEGNIVHDDTLTGVGAGDYYLLKLDANGNRVWDFLRGGDRNQLFTSVHTGSDGVYVSGGCLWEATFEDTTIRSSSNAMNFIAKYDATGEYQWVVTTNTTRGGTPKGLAHIGNQVWTAGGFGGKMILGPDTMGTNPNFYSGFIGQFTDLGVPPPRVNPPLDLLGVFPNPTNSLLNCNFILPHAGDYTMKFLDTSGRLVREYRETSEENGFLSRTLDLSDISSGMYFLRIDGLQIHQTWKVLVQR